MKLIECLIFTVSASVAFPQAKSGCGVDEQGVARKSGDSWQEECNRCRCLPSGVPGCTKKLCGTISDTTLQPDTFDIKIREQETCGVDEQGVVRKPGDSWQEECNRCRCLPSGVPGCTKKLCGSVLGFVDPEKKTCKDSNGTIQEDGALWEEEGSSKVCTCSKGVVLCTSLQTVTENDTTLQPGMGDIKTREKASCGLDEQGVARTVGDSWKEDCNQCRCLESGVPGCTRRFCGSNPVFVETESKICQDSNGNSREEGTLWEENGRSEVCTCIQGGVQCTSLQPVPESSTSQPGTEGPNDIKVRFPGDDSSKVTCTDVNGNTRNEGDSWKEDCNTCGCSFAGKVCTQAFCVNIDQDTGSESTLFTKDDDKDMSDKTNTVTCTDADGNTRNEGDSWKEDCNTCGCSFAGKVCTQVFCVNIDQDTGSESTLFTEVDDKDTSDKTNTVTCTDADGNTRNEGDSWKEDCNTCG